MKQPQLKNWVNAKRNDDFISLKTGSGYFNFLDDPEAPEHLLPLSATEEEIGRALLDALSRSRILNPKENRDFFSLEQVSAEYEKWVKQIMEKFKYKTRRAMFLNMKSCSIYTRENIMIIGPTNHVKLEAWGRDKSDGIEDVVIPVGSSSIEVGSALKQAFDRCG